MLETVKQRQWFGRVVMLAWRFSCDMRAFRPEGASKSRIPDL